MIAMIAIWREGIEAGNLYINRGTTGAIACANRWRQWKSSFGPG